MFWVVLTIVAVLGGLSALAIWSWYLSTGSVSSVTLLPTDEVLDGVENFFVRAGWKVEETTSEFTYLQRPSSASTALLFLVLFLPLGLVYLLTSWAHGKLEVSVEAGTDEQSNVHFRWNDAFLRGDIRRLVDWLEDDGGEGEHA